MTQHQQPTHQPNAWPMFMTAEQREELIRAKFDRAHHYIKLQGDRNVRSRRIRTVVSHSR
jgi:hypothetical protein